MYNDLIFPILPRNTKVPVVGDTRIKKISPSIKEDTLNQDEREQHEATHRVDEKQLHEQHKRVEAKRKKEQQNKNAQSLAEEVVESDTKENTDEQASDVKSDNGRKHLDLYV